MGFSLAIKEWQAWLPDIETKADWQAWAQNPHLPNSETKASAKAIAPMQRRRLSPLGRACAQTLLSLEQVDNITETPIIFVSRHGETSRTLTLLEDLGQNQLLSPADFSLSVHNAIAGVLSINKKITANITAIAGHGSEVYSALVEAKGLLCDGHKSVAVCICDAPIPTIYQHFPCDALAPYALTLLLENDSNTENTELSVKPSPQESPTYFSRDNWQSIDALVLIETLINDKHQCQINAGQHCASVRFS